MKDLSSEGRTITAGCYRENAVHEKEHDPIELASWLLMEMVYKYIHFRMEMDVYFGAIH